MNRSTFARLALLLAMLLLAAVPALAEDGAAVPESGAEVVAQLPEEVEADAGQVDPQAKPALDAGDTGLLVEYEQAVDEAPVELGEIDLPTLPEAADEPPQAPGTEDRADEGPQGPGYAAVADGTRVYADAGLSRVVASFPQGAAVYVESAEADGAVLRIRYDTDAAQGWAEDIPAGYVPAEDVLRYTDSEAEALAAALSADSRVRAVNGVPVPVAVLAEEADAEPEALVQGLGVAARTQAEIQAFANAHPFYSGQINLYSVAPREEPYAIGRLSQVNQQSALNLLNQIRYISGLNANLTLLPEQESMEAAAALVLRLNDGLSHFPDRPAELEDSAYDELYELGYTGAGRSNIAMGYNVTNAILAYMADSDDNNVATVGHRRWILNPRMGRTVMGANGRFSAMYAHDQSDPGGQTRVAWPAQQMPVQFFSPEDPWSVSFGAELDASRIEVDLVRQWDKKTWHFSQASSDGFFAVDNHAYAQRGCVIFRPSGLDSIFIGDAFNVSISNGATGEITRYTVTFFSLDTSALAPLSRATATAVKTDKGNVISWSAVERATGYYVCRREGIDGSYAIVADVAGETAFTDTRVSADSVYYYQVYPHTACMTSPQTASVQAKPPQPDTVALNRKSTVKLYSNDTLQLQASLKPGYAETGLVWRSTNEYVAVVDEDGLVKPVHKGTATISVTTDNNLTAKVKVKVVAPPKPTKVALSESGTVKLNLGQKLTLTTALSPEKAATTLKWTSTDRKVAKVTAKSGGRGVVKGLKEGTVTITVKTANGKKDTVKVKVVDPKKPTKVALNKSGTVKLYTGDMLALKASLSPGTAKTALSWSSSEKTVAKVSRKGVVTAVKAGTATITVKTANGKKDTVKVKVLTPTKPKKVKLDSTGTVELYPGDQLPLTVTLSPASARSALSWSSSRKSVAKVSKEGVVTALKAGTTTVTVKTQNGKKASVKIRVLEE